MLLAVSEFRWVGGCQVKHDGRKDLMRKLGEAQQEMISTDAEKRKDIKKRIHNLKKELRKYDRFNTSGHAPKG